MNVLFDYQTFELQNTGGISRYFTESYINLLKLGVECKLGCKESDNVYLNQHSILPELKPYHYTHDKYLGKNQIFKGQRRLQQYICSLFGQSECFFDVNKQYCIKLLQQQKYDVFHPTFYDPYFLDYIGKKPFVLTIHDMIPELYPQFFRKDDPQIVGKQMLAPLASAIIAVSENTKNDIVRILNVPEDKVHVIYHGCSFNSCSDTRLFVFPYLLYVGDRSGYKNFDYFIYYLVSTLKRHKDLNLVCTGHTFSEHELSLFDSFGIRDRIYHHYVNSDKEFFTLYHHAEAFIYPSGYEGFGIPILEAFSADCPVILNQASCFPEIAGEAAIYFSMNDPSSLSSSLEYILSMNTNERESLLNSQRERLKLFSWKNSAERLLSVYKSLL